MKTKKSDKKPESIQHEGRYQFTDADKKGLAQELAEQCLSMATIEAEKKKVTSEFKAKIDACDARIQRLSEKISNGHEPRVFDCIIEKDIKEKTISYIDVETNRVIESRKMQAHELQLAITDKQKGEEKKDGKEDEPKK